MAVAPAAPDALDIRLEGRWAHVREALARCEQACDDFDPEAPRYEDWRLLLETCQLLERISRHEPAHRAAAGQRAERLHATLERLRKRLHRRWSRFFQRPSLFAESDALLEHLHWLTEALRLSDTVILEASLPDHEERSSLRIGGFFVALLALLPGSAVGVAAGGVFVLLWGAAWALSFRFRTRLTLTRYGLWVERTWRRPRLARTGELDALLKPAFARQSSKQRTYETSLLHTLALMERRADPRSIEYGPPTLEGLAFQAWTWAVNPMSGVRTLVRHACWLDETLMLIVELDALGPLCLGTAWNPEKHRAWDYYPWLSTFPHFPAERRAELVSRLRLHPRARVVEHARLRHEPLQVPFTIHAADLELQVEASDAEKARIVALLAPRG